MVCVCANRMWYMISSYSGNSGELCTVSVYLSQHDSLLVRETARQTGRNPDVIITLSVCLGCTV